MKQAIQSPFSNTTYRRLFLAQVTSLIGSGVTTIALALLAYKIVEDKAGQLLGTLLALKMVIYVFGTPILGSFIHKLPRKTWLIFLDIIRAGLVICLPFVTEVWQIYVAVLLVNACSAGFTPVFQSVIPDVIKDEEQYTKALSYSRLAYDLEQLLSPVLAAGLLAIVTFNELFLLDAGTFVVSGVLVLIATLPKTKAPDRPDNFFYNLKFGIASYVKTPRLRALFFMYLAVACASSMIIVNTVVYVREVLHGDESQTAWAWAVSGAGSMVAALALPKLLKDHPPRGVLLLGTLTLTIGLFAGMTLPGWTFFLVGWFVLGIGLSIVQTPAGSLVRNSCNENDSSAFFVAHFSLSHFCWLIAYPLAGVLSAQFDMKTTFLVLGIVSTVALIAAWMTYPNPDVEEIEHSHGEIVHNHPHHHDDYHNHGHDDSIENEDSHLHRHPPTRHKHKFVIDLHHPNWPS